MAISDIRFSLFNISLQKIDEALHGGRLNSALAKLLYQIQIPRSVNILYSSLPYLHKPGAQQDFAQFV